MADEKDLGPASAGDAARAVEPGTVSRLLVEIFRTSEVDLASSWREPLAPGDVVGRYRIRSEIGRGGFGAVYEAFDPELSRKVALKALKPGRTRHTLSEEWIRKEAEAVARLDHPAIVTIFDVGTCPAGAYLVMELLRGETLARRIAQGPVPADEALRIAEQMAEGLAHAHSRGVLHRDLKPANVFVCEDGRVKLLDFGLAHLLGTDGSSGAGTPAYMAPEQAAGALVDERVDVWAAGMVLGEMLTGRRPVERTPATGSDASEGRTELMWKGPQLPAALPATGSSKLAGVPRAVARVLEAALSEDPGKRPRDGRSWLSELRSARLRSDRPRRLRRLALVGTAFLLLGLAAAGLATWRIWERQIPGGRPTVAVADFANETGEKDLDSISGLLVTSLEQGTRLRVLTRGRMIDVLKQLGKVGVDRIDEPLAREVGKATGANALMLGSIRKLGDSYVVDLRALDPLHDEYIFTVSDRASGKTALFDLVDRLGTATRARLKVADGGAAPPPRVASITTADPRAWELLSRGRRAHERTEGGEAERLLEEALAADPEFALARYQLAIVAWGGRGEIPSNVDLAMERVEAAWAVRDRLPDKEKLILSGVRAQARGHWAEAYGVFSQAAASYPLDKEVLLLAASASYEQDREEEWISFLERAVQLDPGYARAVQSLATAYARSGRADRHLDWLVTQAGIARAALSQATARSAGEQRQSAEANTVRAFATAFLSAGREAEALALYRDAAAADGEPWPPGSYVAFLFFQGRAEEAAIAIQEALASQASSGDTAPRWVGTYQDFLADSSIVRGRFGEVWPRIETVRHRKYPAQLALLGQCLGAATRSPERLRVATQELERLGALHEPRLAGRAVLNLAQAGDLVGARAFATRVSRDVSWADVRPFELGVLEAFARSPPGSFDEVAAFLRSAPRSADPDFRHDRLVLLGEVERARGDCRAAVEALEQARAIPWTPGFFDFVWYRPGRTHSLALCYETLGEIEKARERNEELLRLWVNADPDVPLLQDAKAMQARLGEGAMSRK